MPLTPTIQGYIQNGDAVEQTRSGRMNSCWMCIEHNYGSLFSLFKIMIRDEQHQLLHDGCNIFQLGLVFFCKIVVFALTDNIVIPPTIEDYLPINVNFEPYHPVDLTGIYNYEI